jgi:carboxylate-amine ligase
MSADSSPSSQTEGATAPEDHRFGDSPPLSLGVEEELLLVDEHRALTAVAEAVLEAVEAPFAEHVSAEIFAEQIELKTGVCDGFEDVCRELAETRRAIRAAGFGLLPSGLHPAAKSERAQLVDKPRYAVVRDDFGDLLRTPPCGLHIHVGMPDPETAIRVANAFCLYLPLLQALSANSPFREGVDSGNASSRTSVVRSYPRFQLPRQFRDYEEFRRVADQLIVAAGVNDYTYIWWDVRPHPRLGTVEVRAFDVQTEVTTSAAVAALIQAIAAKELDRPSAPGLYREALEESYFQATSHGLDAEILLDGETPEPAREAGHRVLESVGSYAGELGGAAALEEIERILREGNGADDQRRIERQSGMEGLLAHLAEPAL